MPPEDSTVIADQNMAYPDTDRGFRFKGKLVLSACFIVPDSIYPLPGSRGVNYLHYSNIPSSSLSQLHENLKYPDQPDYRSVYPSYSTDPTTRWYCSVHMRMINEVYPVVHRKGDRYGARFSAFFNPHVSGNHTFYLTSDDEGMVWLSQGNNITDTNR